MTVVIGLALIVWGVGVLVTIIFGLINWSIERGFNDRKAVEYLRWVPKSPMWPLMLAAAIKGDIKKAEEKK